MSQRFGNAVSAISPEQSAEEYLSHLEQSERRSTEMMPEEYDLLAELLARMAYDWNADPDNCAEWWGNNDIETILANAAVCVLRAKDAATPEDTPREEGG